MRAIILISSIFYILGLKISNKIDLVKPHGNSLKKEIIRNANTKKPEKCIDLKDAGALKPAKDSIQGGGSITDQVLEYK